MKQMIRNYEKFIEKRCAATLTNAERERLAAYHREMVANFQHERLVHMIVMFFFVAVTLVLLGICAALPAIQPDYWPLYLLTAVLAIVSGFYIAHYYFLENHIQGLYRFSQLLGGETAEKTA